MVKTISLEVTRTDDWILDAITQLGEFLLKPQRLIKSGTVLGKFQDSNRKNQEHNEDRFQKGAHPDVDDTKKRLVTT